MNKFESKVRESAEKEFPRLRKCGVIKWVEITAAKQTWN